MVPWLPGASASTSDLDPLALAIAPPPNETPAQKASREAAEAAAAKVSESIDEAIKIDKAKQLKQKKLVKVLLLGQAESGKSTTLKSAFSVSFSLFALWMNKTIESTN